MKNGIVCRQNLPLLVVFCLFLPAAIYAQRGQRGAQVPQTAKAAASIDITGTWVSVITEDWKFRMVPPRKGAFDGFPGTLKATFTRRAHPIFPVFRDDRHPR